MSRRTFARMCTAALFAEMGARAARKTAWNDVKLTPEAWVMSQDQCNALRATAREADLRILDSGIVVYHGIPVYVTNEGPEQPFIYGDAFDVRELPTRWEDGPREPQSVIERDFEDLSALPDEGAG